ncbi:NADH dehydrogenase [ubiquinone] 1 beta subcomplex subunit 4 isoform X1 [Ovis canadensis]|uniref:NADH dehydrogenase [ubiquinone] 1 beta subcomplex subunit 4 isoform X1 n=1 Tax=Ovis canadensis TaxID=37174 RepID=UPI003752633A
MSFPKYEPSRLASLPTTLDPAEYDISSETRKAQAERLAIRSRLKREYQLQYNDPSRRGVVMGRTNWQVIEQNLNCSPCNPKHLLTFGYIVSSQNLFHLEEGRSCLDSLDLCKISKCLSQFQTQYQDLPLRSSVRNWAPHLLVLRF